MIPITISPEAAYATKDNIMYPGDDTAATAAIARAEAAINDRLDPSTVSLDADSITPDPSA